MKVILASQNQHKLVELSAILSQLGFEIALESEYGLHVDVDETGTTFEENSLLKAEAVMKASGLPVLADDSGLMVDALDGAPGVYSARFAGEDATDEDNNRLLMEKLHGVKNRQGHYVCVLVAVRSPDDPEPLIAEGTWEGVIAEAPKGSGGFGYDPYFYLPEAGATAAELSPEAKNASSHRGKALVKMARLLKERWGWGAA